MTEILSEHFMEELLRVNREVKKVTGSNLIDIDMMIKHARLKAGLDDCDTSLPALRTGVKEVVVDIFKQQCTEIMFGEGDGGGEGFSDGGGCSSTTALIADNGDKPSSLVTIPVEEVSETKAEEEEEAHREMVVEASDPTDREVKLTYMKNIFAHYKNSIKEVEESDDHSRLSAQMLRTYKEYSKAKAEGHDIDEFAFSRYAWFGDNTHLPVIRAEDGSVDFEKTFDTVEGHVNKYLEEKRANEEAHKDETSEEWMDRINASMADMYKEDAEEKALYEKIMVSTDDRVERATLSSEEEASKECSERAQAYVREKYEKINACGSIEDRDQFFKVRNHQLAVEAFEHYFTEIKELINKMERNYVSLCPERKAGIDNFKKFKADGGDIEQYIFDGYISKHKIAVSLPVIRAEDGSVDFEKTFDSLPTK